MLFRIISERSSEPFRFRISSVTDEAIHAIFDSVAAVDMHTHLFPPQFGTLALSGVDELLTYHYLEAEFFRLRTMSPAQYFALDKGARAEAIWDALFLRNAPISEAAMGVVTVLTSFGLEVNASGLTRAREFFRSCEPIRHYSEVLRLAKLDSVIMTNDPLDEHEARVWHEGAVIAPRFQAALRLDRIVKETRQRWTSSAEIRAFLEQWFVAMQPRYAALSLEDLHVFFEESVGGRVLREAVLPVCREQGVPLALMVGVRRGVNPAIGLAADGVRRSDMRHLNALCREYEGNRFLATYLSLENQQELCVTARLFANLMPFGCWWFLNNCSIMERVTQHRLEMLGTTFVAQHSDARVLEQVIYKWKTTRRVVAHAYARSYERLVEAGYPANGAIIHSDADKLLRGNFEAFTSVRQPERLS